MSVLTSLVSTSSDEFARNRAAYLEQIAELKKSAKGEWADAKEATKEGLEDLGDKIEEFRAMVTDKQKS